MERKLVSLRNVDELIPITFLNKEGELEEAENIITARFGGWNVIVKKNSFNVGELAVMAEIDTILSADIPLFSFLEGKRIRTKKLKGVVSQGVAFTISEILGAMWNVIDDGQLHETIRDAYYSIVDSEYNDGDDWTELVGATKYDEELAWRTRGGPNNVRLPLANAKGNFPLFIPKTDEERIQNLAKELKYDWQGQEVVITEKLDGSSITIYCRGGQDISFGSITGIGYINGICSRNLDLKLDSADNHFIKTGTPYLNKLLNYCVESNRSLALQGEIIGPGIQGNPYKLDKHEIYFFNVFDIDAGRRLTYYQASDITKALDINVVPVLGYNTITHTMEEMLNIADGVSELNNRTNREGIVVRALDGSFSFKVISNKWLLKEKE